MIANLALFLTKRGHQFILAIRTTRKIMPNIEGAIRTRRRAREVRDNISVVSNESPVSESGAESQIPTTPLSQVRGGREQPLHHHTMWSHIREPFPHSPTPREQAHINFQSQNTSAAVNVVSDTALSPDMTPARNHHISRRPHSDRFHSALITRKRSCSNSSELDQNDAHKPKRVRI